MKIMVCEKDKPFLTVVFEARDIREILREQQTAKSQKLNYMLAHFKHNEDYLTKQEAKEQEKMEEMYIREREPNFAPPLDFLCVEELMDDLDEIDDGYYPEDDEEEGW